MRAKTALSTALLAILVAAAAPASAQAACAGEGDQVTSANIAASEASMLCLVNEFRAQNGRGLVVNVPLLAGVARAHSQDMVARHFFCHTNPNGQDPRARATAAGYPPTNDGIGENITWAAPNATPASLMAQFKASTAHRDNMLDASFRGVGIGFAAGNPTPYPGCPSDGIPAESSTLPGGATVTQLFGTDPLDGSGGVIVCGDRIDQLKAKIRKLKGRLRHAEGSERRRVKRKLHRSKRALRIARRSC
jgi:uncharacterized protein YkwD